VVVQNVGNRAFFADTGTATLTIALGERTPGSFELRKLAASEVRFFSVETTIAERTRAGDLVATLAFAPSARVGKVTLDCQTSDNQAVRTAASLARATSRPAGGGHGGTATRFRARRSC
jgi:hypothetical protein